MSQTKDAMLHELKEGGVSDAAIIALSQKSEWYIEVVLRFFNKDPAIGIQMITPDMVYLRQRYIEKAYNLCHDMKDVYHDFLIAFANSDYDNYVETCGMELPFYKSSFNDRELVQLYYSLEAKMTSHHNKYIARFIEAFLFGGLKDKFSEAYMYGYKLSNYEKELKILEKVVPLFSEETLRISLVRETIYNQYKEFMQNKTESNTAKRKAAMEENSMERLNSIKEFLDEYLSTTDVWSISVFYSSKGKSKSSMISDLHFLENHDLAYYTKVREKSKIHLNSELKTRLNRVGKMIQDDESFNILKLYRETHINYADLQSIIHTPDTAKHLQRCTVSGIIRVLSKYERSMFAISDDFIMNDYYSFKGYELTPEDKEIICKTMEKEKLPMVYQIYRDLTREYITEKINN